MIPLRWSEGDRCDLGGRLGRIVSITESWMLDGTHEPWALVRLESGGCACASVRSLQLVPVVHRETEGTCTQEDTTTPAVGPNAGNSFRGEPT